MHSEQNKVFLSLYEPCHDRVGRFIGSLVWNREEAKDLLSETILVAMENFDKLRNHEAFLHFLFGIAIRLIRKRKRKNWRTQLFGDQEWKRIESLQKSEVSEDLRDLHVLLDTLSDSAREALVLFEISGFSIKEIAVMQKVGESAVKSRLARSRNSLQKIFIEEQEHVLETTFKQAL